ncbi:hypothetical protein ACPPVO_22660 [Dactylosporangium sp. McL0621]|uniref:hypothetical protein n=1 Tax=Dactylosporangium sp. McL0621 TaxID=3415678 RepID=UPI003CF3E287
MTAVAEVERALAAAHARLAEAVAAMCGGHERYLGDFESVYRRRLLELHRDGASRLVPTDVTFAGLVTGLSADHPWAFASYDDNVWRGYAPDGAAGVPTDLRIGSLALPGVLGLPDVPALVPLVGSGHVVISAGPGAQDLARSVLESLLVRLVTATAPGSVRLALADPHGNGRYLAAFLRLPAPLRFGDRVAADHADVDVLLQGLAEPMTAADALVRCLAALGIPNAEIPVDLDDCASRYRTEIAGRRMLIVLDNASSVEQVRPLLPGTGSCAVLVTSRDSLAGLVAVHGARRLDLELLPHSDAIALLRCLIGARVDAAPSAAAVLADQCVRLPLALRIAAELAVSHSATPLADLVAELADRQQRLDLLDAGGDPRAAVAAVFSWSFQHLPPAAARAFPLLGLHPGPDLDVYAAAALADTTLAQARRILGVLARANLVRTTNAGRYGMHDLLRAYATSLATGDAADDEPQRSLGRLFDYYLATAASAMDVLNPAETRRRPRIPPPATPTPEFADSDMARKWLDGERFTLASVTAYTAAHGWPDHTVRLSNTLFRYLDNGYYTDALVIHRTPTAWRSATAITSRRPRRCSISA